MDWEVGRAIAGASSSEASDDTTSTDVEHVVAALHDAWRLERLIGSGSQGHVWLARAKQSPKTGVAVKLLRDCADARAEVAAYERLRRFNRHPHVLDIAFAIGDG